MYTISLRVSACLVSYLVFLHLLLTLSIQWAVLPVMLKAPLHLLTMVSLLVLLRRHCLDGVRVDAITLTQDHCLLHRGGDRLEAHCLPGAFATTGLQVLRFRIAGGGWHRIAVIILPDSAGNADRRQLRRYLAGWLPDVD